MGGVRAYLRDKLSLLLQPYCNRKNYSPTLLQLRAHIYQGDQYIQLLSRFFLHGWKHMGIGVECQSYIRMPKTFLDYLGVHTLLEHQCGRCMAQVVEADYRQPSFL